MAANDEAQTSYQSRALDRGLTVLECLARSRSGSESLAELHSLTDLPKSTLLRLLSVLERRGFVRSIADGARYRLGHSVVDLAESYRRGADVAGAALPYLTALAHETRQTANLGVLEGGRVLHVLVQEPERALRFRSVSGARDAVHCTGLGKMLLAGLVPAEARELLLGDGPLEARTERTLTDPAAVMLEVDRSRARRFAVDDEEGALGVCCLAVPLPMTGSGGERWTASISLAGPVGEMSGTDRDRLLNTLGRTAERMAGDPEFVAAFEMSPWA